MGEVTLHAIGIDEVRDLFSGQEAPTARLTELADAAFPPETTPGAVGLLAKLGPLLRRPPGAPVVRPDVPTGADVAALTRGRDLPTDRLVAGWTLVRLWWDDRAWGHLTLSLGEGQLDDLDFALSAAGVDARFALRRLFNDQVAIPLKARPGQVTGYVKNGHARAMATAWRPALDRLPQDAARVARPIADWLDRFEDWTRRARDDDRPAPDLVASWQAVSRPPTG